MEAQRYRASGQHIGLRYNENERSKIVGAT
jgi:hypothetical protein